MKVKGKNVDGADVDGVGVGDGGDEDVGVGDVGWVRKMKRRWIVEYLVEGMKKVAPNLEDARFLDYLDLEPMSNY